MNAIQSLALFWGFITVGVYLPTLLNRQFYRTMLKVKEDEAFIILSALISITTGAASLAVVHGWNWGLMSVITAMGWLNLLKGTFRLFAVGYAKEAVKSVEEHNAVYYPIMVAVLAFGFYLLHVTSGMNI